MNVFIIPSWYPHRYSFVEGVYSKEQAIALGELRPNWRVAVSLWGYGENTLPLRAPFTLFRHLHAYLTRPRETVGYILPNLLEYRHSTLLWSRWMPESIERNRNTLIRANRHNLQRAISELGRIDLIHAHCSYPGGWIAMHLSRETQIPYVITEHMSPFPFPTLLNQDGSLDVMVHEPLVRAHARIAVSPAHADQIAGYGIPKPIVIPNLVDEQLFEVVPPALKSGYVFFTLGSMVPQKGIVDLMEAIACFVAQLPPESKNRVSFRIGGDGKELESYQDLANHLGIEKWVVWLGRLSREEAKNEFQRCDCFVLPSHHESFGIVYAEATACGKPVIATRCGGPEYIVTPENGLLVDVGRPDRLATALTTMYNVASQFDPSTIREQFLKRFSRPVVVRQIEQVYREVLTRAQTQG